ncbi:MAG: 30S ribosomal protein S1 [Alphaproteobacteria bacterium]|nr:30S ribosomal protein S1 [Alphaproteobacteria bacterium]MBQ8870475.1 30S ribosomal protein S1 [Alphaproteobacteria bacterium]
MTNTEFKIPETTESFEELLNEQFGDKGIVGTVVKGTIIRLSDDFATVDVGLKSEGRIPLREFGQNPELKIGDQIEVLVDRYEDREGNIVLSREKARREEAWAELEKSMNAGERVNGIIFGRVKGGFTVDLSGAIAFLPGSQIDIRPIRDISPLMGISQPFQILKMDRERGNIVVSRRVVLEETRAEARAELIDAIKEGAILDGIVKNITDYGAFIDLGGVDGLLHVTDISWKRINHPAELLSVGQTIKVQVIKFNEDTQRISLGMKQLENDPWQAVADKYTVGEVYTGKVTNITDYGAFVELEDGIEGLVHVSEMSWTRKNVHPGKIVSTSEEVQVKVLEVDADKRRISLGIKQCTPNPWAAYIEEHPAGSVIEGKIKNITEFGLFVGLTDEIDGMIHLSDIAWGKSGEEAVKDYEKGQTITAKIIDVDVEKERISLGVKQLDENNAALALENLKKGDVVKAIVVSTDDKGVNVEVEGIAATIKKADLSKDKEGQNPENYHEGDVLEAKLTSVDKKNGKLGVSVKALEIEEEKKTLEEYSASNASGTSLGDALGEALKKTVA